MGAVERVPGARVVRDRESRRREALLVVAASAVAPVAARGELPEVRIAMAGIAALELAQLRGGPRSMTAGAVDGSVTADERESGLAVLERAFVDRGPGGLAMAVGAVTAETGLMRIGMAGGAGGAAHVVDEDADRGPSFRRSDGARRRVRPP
jgi:hypothetical protein